LAKIQFGDDPDEVRRAHDLSSFAINLEYVGDAISKTFAFGLAERRRDQKAVILGRRLGANSTNCTTG